MGPSAIRYAGLASRIAELGHEVVDHGNVETAVAEATEVGDERARFLPEIKATCERIARLVADDTRAGFMPVVLGGDHSIALGTLAGLCEAHGPGGAIWIDAHGDLNSPETTPSGNVHGMVLAAGAGFVHVSLDMDALDPDVAPGVGTPVRGGLSYREAHLALELVAESGLLGSLEIVEVNPILDRENATAELAVELAASAFGATIL